MFRLVISDDEGTTTVVPLVRDEVSIGRKEGNTIRLTERNVSRNHAKLARSNGGFVLHDLESYNGVSVNGALVEGQSPLQAGDRVVIGDYTLLVELEGQAAEPVPTDDDATTRVATVASRLVMLGEPNPGSEYGLPASGAVRIGRSEGLGVPIDHPSVSREHAEILSDANGCRVVDLGSANGVNLNGQSIDEMPLAAGDVIEVGQVLLRFVPASEAYAFDPGEAEAYRRLVGGQSRSNLRWAAAVLGLAVVAGVLILVGGEEEQPPETVTTLEPQVAPAVAEPVEEPEPSAEGALADCRAALEGARYAEAMAHGARALKLDPESTEAVACQAAAQKSNEQEQTFVAGKSALDQGDAETAYGHFVKLSEDSPFASRPEVQQAVESLGLSRITQARAVLDSDPAGATTIAGSILNVSGMPESQKEEARALIAEADASRAAKPSRPAAARAAKPRRAQTRATKQPAAARPTPEPSGKSPMEEASGCLARGDNACVVRALNGKARSPQELGLLIETYRAMGNTKAAQRNMALYLKRYPTARKAAAYQQMMDRK